MWTQIEIPTGVSPRGKATGAHGKKAAIYKPRRETSREINPDNTLIMRKCVCC